MPYNKALHQTRRGGAAASRPVVEARLAGEGWCSTDVDEPTATAVGTSKRVSDLVGCPKILAGFAPSNLRGGYGGILAVESGAQKGTTGTAWLGSIGLEGAWLGSEPPEEHGEALGTTGIPSNNGLQLTRSARSAPSPSDWGQSLRAALAAEAGGGLK